MQFLRNAWLLALVSAFAVADPGNNSNGGSSSGGGSSSVYQYAHTILKLTPSCTEANKAK